MLGAIFVAEIGDVHRFPSAARLCSWAGMLEVVLCMAGIVAGIAVALRLAQRMGAR